jgi:hypothetical protein
MPKPDDVKNWDDLSKLTVPRLRELTAEDTQLSNTTGLEKPELLEALAQIYGIERPKQVRAEGIKTLKRQMKGARKERDELLAVAPAQRDKAKLKRVRTRMRRLKRQMRRLAKAS